MPQQQISMVQMLQLSHNLCVSLCDMLPHEFKNDLNLFQETAALSMIPLQATYRGYVVRQRIAQALQRARRQDASQAVAPSSREADSSEWLSAEAFMPEVPHRNPGQSSSLA